MGKGSNKERELLRKIDDYDEWIGMRAPSSGSATDRDLPDFIAGNGRVRIVGELKTSGGNPVYVKKEEVEQLNRCASAFDAVAYLVVRWSSRSLQDSTFYFNYPTYVPRTNQESYRIAYDDMDEWQPLANVLTQG